MIEQEYKAKHCACEASEGCGKEKNPPEAEAAPDVRIEAEEVPDIKEVTVCISADIPNDGYYKARIKQLEEKNSKLEEEKEGLKDEVKQLSEKLAESNQRTSKLEKALIEATIR